MLAVDSLHKIVLRGKKNSGNEGSWFWRKVKSTMQMLYRFFFKEIMKCNEYDRGCCQNYFSSGSLTDEKKVAKNNESINKICIYQCMYTASNILKSELIVKKNSLPYSMNFQVCPHNCSQTCTPETYQLYQCIQCWNSRREDENKNVISC